VPLLSAAPLCSLPFSPATLTGVCGNRHSRSSMLQRIRLRTPLTKCKGGHTSSSVDPPLVCPSRSTKRGHLAVARSLFHHTAHSFWGSKYASHWCCGYQHAAHIARVWCALLVCENEYDRVALLPQTLRAAALPPPPSVSLPLPLRASYACKSPQHSGLVRLSLK